MACAYHAEGNAVDYTPVADMVAGDAIKFGTFIGIAQNDIAANELGALRTVGIFKITKADALGAMTLGAEYDFDFTEQEVVAGGAGDADVQVFAAAAAGASDTVCYVWINSVGG